MSASAAKAKTRMAAAVMNGGPYACLHDEGFGFLLAR
jgi:hypothetical protein